RKTVHDNKPSVVTRSWVACSFLAESVGVVEGGCKDLTSFSRSSSRWRIFRLATSKTLLSPSLVTHSAPTFSQNEHVGFLLSHFVRLALHSWHALMALCRGYDSL